MQEWKIQIHHLHTEAAKIRSRIQYIRNITYKITEPDVLEEVSDLSDLYRSLDSLNHLIEVYEEQLADFELRIRSAKQLSEQFYNHRTKDGIISRDMVTNLSALGKLITEFRENMSEDLAAAESILHVFTQEARRY